MIFLNVDQKDEETWLKRQKSKVNIVTQLTISDKLENSNLDIQGS